MQLGSLFRVNLELRVRQMYPNFPLIQFKSTFKQNDLFFKQEHCTQNESQPTDTEKQDLGGDLDYFLSLA